MFKYRFILVIISIVSFNSVISQKIDSTTNFTYDTLSHTFINSSQQTFTYNNRCNLIRYNYNFWDSSRNRFTNYYRTTNSLLANNSISQTLSQIWDDATNKWLNYQKSNYTYSTNPTQPSSILKQNFSSINSTWINYENYIYYYDINGKDSIILIQVWQNNNWQNNYLYNYTYDANGTLLNFDQKNWNASLNIWNNFYKICYSNSNLKVLNDSSFFWDKTNNVWKIYSKNEYTYNANYDLISYQFNFWDSINNIFLPFQKSVNKLNTNGNVDSTITYAYNNYKLSWDTVSLDVNSYNSCILPIDEIYLTVNQNEDIKLNFKINGSKNYKNVIIEKSINGNEFYTFSRISDYNSSKFYSDIDAVNEIIYYRIKAITIDGEVVYSNTVFINNKRFKNDDFKIFENPITNSSLKIYSKTNCSATILNTLGIPLKKLRINAGINIIDISMFSNQQYYILFNLSNNFKSLKFVKN